MRVPGAKRTRPTPSRGQTGSMPTNPLSRLGLVALLLWAPAIGLAQDWKLTRTQALSPGGPQAWRYALAPAGRESRELWERLAGQYRDLLRGGYRVDLGAWRLYFLGGRLRVEAHCPSVHPACLTFGALPVPKARQDRLLMELAQLLDKALVQVQGTGGRLTLTRLFRLEVPKGTKPPYPASPSGWQP